MLILRLCEQLNEEKVPYLLVGGYALALQGVVRATVDIDLVVSLKEEHLVKAELILKRLNLESRLPIRATEVAKFHDKYHKERNLIAWSFVDFKNPMKQVDLLIHPPLTTLKGEKISVHGIPIHVATKRTLIKMKRASNRPQDQLDAIKLEEIIDEEKKR